MNFAPNAHQYKAGINMPNLPASEFDTEGFLKNLNDWNRQTATEIATMENISLSDAHWEIINLTRNFYSTFEISPSMRALVKYVEKSIGKEKGNSLYLLHLFPQSPAKIICKIAGLPKPANCM